MAKVRVGINGFGRIGRCVVRAMQSGPDSSKKSPFDIVLVNDLTDAKTLGHLLRYDSIHGRFDGKVEVGDDGLTIAGDKLVISKEPDPAKIPWKDHGVDIVLECTGRFTERADAEKHLQAGAKKVIISAPAKRPDITLACGINLDSYDSAKHHVISNASCTTNCLAPVAKVLHESFEIVSGVMTTIHSYTNDQRILDLPHKDLRRARAAAVNMIPTTTGAARALKEVLPVLEGKLDGMAIRVPTPNVSCVDLTCVLGKDATRDQVNDAFRAASNGPLKGILAAVEDELVSGDYNGDTHSASVDVPSTMVTGGRGGPTLCKVLAWYDNERGYSQRLFDVAEFVAGKL